MKKIILMAVLMLILPISVFAQTFEVLNYNSLVRQGDVLMIKLASSLREKDIHLFVFDELYQFNKNGHAFVGVDVERKPGRYIMYLVETKENERIQHDFYYTYVEVLEKQFGNPWYAGPLPRPSKAVQEQRAKEKAIKDGAYSLADISNDFTEGRFILPLGNAEVTDEFGVPRIYGAYNRRTKKTKVENKVPHGGTDFRARIPLPVRAVNSGKILLVHWFPIRGTEGKMLVIDHGSGVLSLYLHLSKFMVKKGDTVKSGQIVAMTGATPVRTSPHLHFMIKVHGLNVDPVGFTNDFNRYMDR